MNGKLRLGMIGGGGGAFFGPVHRIAARLDGRFELVAGAFSSRPEGAAEAGALLADPSRSYADYQTMIAAEAARADGVQIVTIVTPNHLHFEAAKACLEAGIAVLCEKPLCLTMEEARALVALSQERDLICAVSYTYTGYPMVREAAAIVAGGGIGSVRGAQIRYAQDWLAAPIEASGAKQAVWRTDPRLAGPGGCLGDIGTHCFNLLTIVTGQNVASLSADLRRMVPGRRLDDEVQIALRLENGAACGIWASQVAIGFAKNGLALHVYGDTGGLEWEQENPDSLRLTTLDGGTRLLRRGEAGLHAQTVAATRLPGGHPEAYFEALGQIYRDIADHWDKGAKAPLFGTAVADGAAGIAFIEACVASAAERGAWVSFKPRLTAADEVGAGRG